jgi:hypothetical protein
MVKRTDIITGIHLRLPTPEDLIITKLLHNFERLEDIKAVATSHPNLDIRLEHWVEQFGTVIEMPELWIEIEAHES